MLTVKNTCRVIYKLGKICKIDPRSIKFCFGIQQWVRVSAAKVSESDIAVINSRHLFCPNDDDDDDDDDDDAAAAAADDDDDDDDDDDQ